jgi:DNA-binding transcriptional ArsR family regulator
MSSEEDRPRDFDLTDPKVMRALAHPARMRLLELLASHETLTASQAAELMGESPANCAFHLRTLAKYGFVQEAGGGRGRERPWRNATRGINLSRTQSNPQAAIAAQALGDMFRERSFERVRRAFTAPLPGGWDKKRTATFGNCYVTPDEFEQMTKDIREIINRYVDRDDDLAQRPEGAQFVELVFFGYPDLDEIRDTS